MKAIIVEPAKQRPEIQWPAVFRVGTSVAVKCEPGENYFLLLAPGGVHMIRDTGPTYIEDVPSGYVYVNEPITLTISPTC